MARQLYLAAARLRQVRRLELLAGQDGRLVGVVSTHYPRPYALPTRDMRIIKRYADLVGQVMAASRSPVPADGASTA